MHFAYDDRDDDDVVAHAESYQSYLLLGAYMQKAGDTCDISPIHRKFFWIFRKILGSEREINTAPKPSPEVAPSKMEVAPS